MDNIKEHIYSTTEVLNYSDFHQITGELSIYTYEEFNINEILFLLQRFPDVDTDNYPDIITEMVKMLKFEKFFEILIEYLNTSGIFEIDPLECANNTCVIDLFNELAKIEKGLPIISNQIPKIVRMIQDHQYDFEFKQLTNFILQTFNLLDNNDKSILFDHCVCIIKEYVELVPSINLLLIALFSHDNNFKITGEILIWQLTNKIGYSLELQIMYFSSCTFEVEYLIQLMNILKDNLKIGFDINSSLYLIPFILSSIDFRLFDESLDLIVVFINLFQKLSFTNKLDSVKIVTLVLERFPVHFMNDIETLILIKEIVVEVLDFDNNAIVMSIPHSLLSMTNGNCALLKLMKEELHILYETIRFTQQCERILEILLNQIDAIDDI